MIDIILGQAGLNITEGEFQYDELNYADCIWLTNSVLEILPVRSVDGKRYHTDDPVFELLHNELQKMKRNEVKE